MHVFHRFFNCFFRRIFYSFIVFFIMLSPAKAVDTSNDFLMNATIWGAIGSLAFACYQGKAPCSLTPDIDSDKLTLSTDIGSDNSVEQFRLALGADWKSSLYESDRFDISGRWEINTNFWHSTLTNPLNEQGFVIGLTPVFQYAFKTPSFKPYLEMGGGPQFLSDITIENEYKSTLFQFGSVFGLGITTKRFEIGYRYLHISNANIELPNPGTDFHSLHLGYKF